MKHDVIVVGAGIVGVCTAIHLQRRGQAVLLVDRTAPGLGTSFGNSGLIERQAVVPYGFPREFGRLLHYAANRSVDVHYHPTALPALAGFLFRYWRNSEPGRLAVIAQAYEKLIEHCVVEHDDLIAASNAGNLIRRDGWLKIFRDRKEWDRQLAEAERLHRDHGIEFANLDKAALAREEPSLIGVLGAIHLRQPLSTVDPGGLVAAYADYYRRLGGSFAQGDARSLEAGADGWEISTVDGRQTARQAVVALGPWSALVTRRLGYDLPLAVKRGYHMHYRPAEGARLNHPIYDVDGGYMLAPMMKGIRLTTGAEFAHRDAPPSPVQVDRAEPLAKQLFPLAGRVDAQPWMGARPCTADMLPIIGPAPRHRGLWFAFGHSHHGLTLAGITGRLIAEMATGEAPSVDPSSYRVDRF